MKRLIVILTLGLGLSAGSELARPTKARCAYCFTGDCYNSRMCGRGCVCLKRDNDMRGECVAFD